MSTFTNWKASVLGRGIDIDKRYGNQCVDVSNHYAMYLYPGISWATLMGAPMSAKDLFTTANERYFEKIKNNPSDVNQLPKAGDIAIFAAAPEAGYSSKYYNPDGHVGIVDSADSRYLYLVQQDGSTGQSVTELRQRPWRYTRCIGWLRPRKLSTTPAAPQPAPSYKRVTFPAHVASWAVYKLGSGARKGTSDQVGSIAPAKFGGLTYVIQGYENAGNAVVIQTETFGRVKAWVKDTDARIF